MFSRRWLFAAVTVWVLAAGCSEFNTNLTTQTSSSVLSFLSPAQVPAGGAGFTITANGAGFVSGAIIIWNVGPNQVALTTTFVNNSTLTAPVPASDITAAGTIQVAIQIPGSAVSATSSTSATTTTEVSNVVNFTIGPPAGPAPAISTISAPSSSLAAAPYCQPNGFALTVNGSNFVSSSVVNWNGNQRVTNFVSSTKLTASILPSDTAFPVPVQVSVSNPSGSPSNSVPFTLTTPTTGLPAPVISSLSQTSAQAGSNTFTLTVNGSSFVPCSVVQWDGNAKATTFVSATQLNATIPATDIFSAGPGGTSRTVNVTVFTLAPGGGTSSAIPFTINP